ncbi:hypothetical protein Hanom_Chr05g00475421 [Helianthus anomalus]
MRVFYIHRCFIRSIVMAQPAVCSGWLKGKLKVVPSSNTLICSDGATSCKFGLVERKGKSCSVW